MSLFETTWDVVVLGGGLAGSSAAWTAATAGVRTLMVEPRATCGWEIAWAHAPGRLGAQNGFAAAVEAELASLDALGPARLDPAFFEIALDRVLDRAGVTLLLYSHPVRLLPGANRVAAALLATKAGLRTVTGRVFVDATDRSALWAQEGGRAAGAVARARFSLFAWTEEPMAEAVRLGDIGDARDVRVGPTARPDLQEIAFEPRTPSLVAARLAVPAVLQAARAPAGPLPAHAIVTHSAPELLVMRAGRGVGHSGAAHPRLANLFLAAAVGRRPRVWEALPPLLVAAGHTAGTAASAAAPAFEAAPPPAAGPLLAPPRRAHDVLVAGGGTGGAFAALAAARRGKSVVVIEASTCLGGIPSGGGIHSYYYGIAGGLQDEVDRRTGALSPLFTPEGRVRGFHPEARKIALEQLLSEAGVEVRYGSLLCGVVTETVASMAPMRLAGTEPALRCVREAMTADADGLAVQAARVFVDATGDGDLAARAGAEFRYGRPGDGLLHAYSLSSGAMWAPENEPRKMAIVNFDAGYVDPTDPEDLTRARREGLRLFPGPRNGRPTYIAPQLGLRCSRLIVGDRTLTFDDLLAGRRFPDAVLETWGHMDNHAADVELESDASLFWVSLLKHWGRVVGSEVPYGILLPRGLEGVLVACRAASMTVDAHYLFRMQRDMQRLGEIAGIAAALAIDAGVTPRGLDVQALRAELVRSGALVPPGTAPRFIALRDATQGARALPAGAGYESLEQELAGERGSAAFAALAELAPREPGARGLLRRACAHADAAVRVRAAGTLAMVGDGAAVPALVAAIAQRQGGLDVGKTREIPEWIAAAALLGRLRAREAVTTLCEVVADANTPLAGFIAAVRALGRIGDPSAAAALAAAADRDDLRAKRESAAPSWPVSSAAWDRRWQLDLVLAQALARLGAPRRALVERYLEDPRAPVRRFALAVIEETDAASTPLAWDEKR